MKKASGKPRYIDVERIDLLFKHSGVGITATIITGLVCVYMLRDFVEPYILTSWISLLLVVSLTRILIVMQYNRRRDKTELLSRYKFWNIFTLAVSGLIWGISAIFLFPSESIAHQLFLAILTIGMVAGATMAFSIFQAAFLAFAIPALLPVIVRFLLSPLELHLFTGLSGILFFGMSLLISRQNKINRLEYLTLKKNLADQMEQQTEALRQANACLQDENQKRSRIQAELEETRKFEAIANLAGGIAHQFNNALSVIIGNTELLTFNQEDKLELKPYLDPITESAHQMSKLTSQLLAYAKGGKYKPQIVELGGFVNATLSTIGQSLSPDLKLNVDIGESSSKVEIDLIQMQMVISAVIVNAAEATHRKGTVEVICRRDIVDEPRNDRHGRLLPGDYMVVEVTDDGAGMDEETLQRIFEPFFTTKFQGRGLGMAAVFGIIKNHQGHISISSRKGCGTRVRIYLPTHTPLPRPAAETPAPKTVIGNGRVLLIEDEAMVMDINRQLLERIGYSVVKALDGKTAIDLIRRTEPAFDLVLLDLKLPDMDGAAIYPIIRQHRPAAKVIVCSGYDLKGRTQTLLDQGADGFIQKPFTLEAISAKLSQVLAPAATSHNKPN